MTTIVSTIASPINIIYVIKYLTTTMKNDPKLVYILTKHGTNNLKTVILNDNLHSDYYFQDHPLFPRPFQAHLRISSHT